MKKVIITVSAAAAGLLIIAAAALLILTGISVGRAEELHSEILGQYNSAVNNARLSILAVTENGGMAGEFNLEELGLLEDTLKRVERAYSDTDRMAQEDFERMPFREKLEWAALQHPVAVDIAVNTAGFDAAPILERLNESRRVAARDAYAYFKDSAYYISPDVPGTMLDGDAVAEAALECLSSLTLSPENPARGELEITDYDCYIPPRVTEASAGFDFQAMLEEDIRGVTIEVRFHNAAVTLDSVAIAALLSVDTKGRLHLDDNALDLMVEEWAALYAEYNTAYLFKPFIGEVKALSFIRCDYEVDEAWLREELESRLLYLDGGELYVRYNCSDKNGRPFDISGTYLEVDIGNQHLAYYKNDELVVDTDIVTGRPGGWSTPTGYYSAYDKQVNRWLTGDDYNVFVKYWVRVTGHYGLHDASWRSRFGGEYYKYGGSHGCVNIPESAMELIYENIDEGTPIVIH